MDRVAVRTVGRDFGIRFDGEWWVLFGIVESEWLAILNEKAPSPGAGDSDGRS